MPDLLTAKDVEVRAFKKVSFGGYAIPEVEEFLNQVADDIETYALRLEESERRIQELEDLVQKQESITDMIKDALIQARKSAKEMEEAARLQTEEILIHRYPHVIPTLFNGYGFGPPRDFTLASTCTWKIGRAHV